MNDTSFLGLVQNTALLLAVAFIFDVAANRRHKGESSLWQALVGLTLGTIGITVMLTPWSFVPGIVFDTRSILIGISGLFFGSVPTVIAMAMTAAFRFYQGGTGAWTGVTVILTSGVIGIAWRHLRRRPLAEISWRELYLFGMVVHIAMLVVMLTLPWETALRVLSSIALPVILIYPLGTALLGVFMVNRLRRQQAEETLRESEELYTKIIATMPDIMVRMNLNGEILFISDVGHHLGGYPGTELIGQNMLSIIAPEDHDKAARNTVLMFERKLGPQEYHLITKDGRKLLFEVNGDLLRNEDGSPYGMVQICRDITERKKAEEDLRKTEETYRLVVDNMADVITVLDLNLRFTYVSPSVIRLRGYTAEEVMAQTLEQIMTPESLQIAAGVFEEELKLEASGTEDPYRSRILELEEYRKDGSIVLLENHLSTLRDKEKKLVGIIALSYDISDRKRAEKQLQDTLESLRKAVGTTIQVMVSAVEARDPYTSGHQIRSADLARAIATEMGLSQEKIEGIRMAGSIHDIGKLSIPAEILSKPTKLTDIEFSLIKEHARQGYKMLKDVESPWPLAEIVRQHHERMDGSGYPRNLQGEEILIEARILAVADVVEAMASHRPYRPGLGIDAALNEIEKNRGIFYDNAVADACLRLFREKGFKLEGT